MRTHTHTHMLRKQYEETFRAYCERRILRAFVYIVNTQTVHSHQTPTKREHGLQRMNDADQARPSADMTHAARCTSISAGRAGTSGSCCVPAFRLYVELGTADFRCSFHNARKTRLDAVNPFTSRERGRSRMLSMRKPRRKRRPNPND